jgi:hypothetical protein
MRLLDSVYRCGSADLETVRNFHQHLQVNNCFTSFIGAQIVYTLCGVVFQTVNLSQLTEPL